MKAVLVWLLMALPLAGLAQTYPAKPVKIIVPANPGGGLDLIGRTVADQLGRALGQSFIVENSAGARRLDRLDEHRPRGARRLHADGRLRRHARHQSRRAQGAL